MADHLRRVHEEVRRRSPAGGSGTITPPVSFNVDDLVLADDPAGTGSYVFVPRESP